MNRRFERACARGVLLLLAVAAASPLPAETWGWSARFTEHSAEELKQLHSTIHGSGIRLSDGVRVEDVHFESDGFDLHMRSGAIYLEPEIDGASFGAFFAGDATVSFSPGSKAAAADLELSLGSPGLDAEPIAHAYFFTLSGTSLVEQLGIDGEPSVTLEAREEYALSKRALRQLGTRLVHSFLERGDGADGTSFVLFAPDSIRTSNSPEALLLYASDPTEEFGVSLSVFGSANLFELFGYEYNFFPLAEFRAADGSWKPAADVESYAIDIDVAGRMGRVEETTLVEFTPSRPLSALRVALTPRLEVDRISLGSQGDPLPFAQWGFLAAKANFDNHVVVSFPQPLEAGKTYQLLFNASGPLFDATELAMRLADEDNWHPNLDDPDGALYDTRVSVPKGDRAVGVGELVREEVADGRRHYHFKTTRPQIGSTFYCGTYDMQKGKADDVEVEVYQYRAATSTHSDLKWAVKEVTNAVRVFNRILMPLESKKLRVAGTPTGHGRGFEGLIILSWLGVGDTLESGGDVFRAHEVAHQWWGNIVRPQNWPEDRWLSESTAEYSAMEYYQIRYQSDGKTRAQIRERWYKPLVDAPKTQHRTLTGEKSRLRASERVALIQGGNNVYTKGPMMLHMLRYLFRMRQGSDENFWMVLQDYLEQYKYQRSNTQDFIDLVEQRMGGKMPWFWDQWLYGTDIPTVAWSKTVEPVGGQWKITVEAEQADTDFVLAIPIYVQLKNGNEAITPLILQGRSGSREFTVPTKPDKISLNDNLEALVQLTRR